VTGRGSATGGATGGMVGGVVAGVVGPAASAELVMLRTVMGWVAARGSA